jgi:hypothetical protein
LDNAKVNLSKGLYLVTSYRQYTRALTFENFWQRMGTSTWRLASPQAKSSTRFKEEEEEAYPKSSTRFKEEEEEAYPKQCPSQLLLNWIN